MVNYGISNHIDTTLTYYAIRKYRLLDIDATKKYSDIVNAKEICLHLLERLADHRENVKSSLT